MPFPGRSRSHGALVAPSVDEGYRTAIRAGNLPDASAGTLARLILRILPWSLVCALLLVFSIHRYQEGVAFERDLRQTRQLEKHAVALYFSGFDLKSTMLDSLLVKRWSTLDIDQLIDESLARLDGQLSVAEMQLINQAGVPALPPLRRTFAALQVLCKDIARHQWRNGPAFNDQQRRLLQSLMNQWFIEVEALNSVAQFQVIRLDAELSNIHRGNLMMFAAVGMVTLLMIIDIIRIWSSAQKAHARREAALTELAHIDPLTGLLNRRGWEPNALRAVRRCQQEGKALTVVMVDLDYFKNFNDHHGHQAGDEVLQSFARQLTQKCRPGDVVARMGGEEFAIALPGCGMSAAVRLVERIRDEIILATTFSAGLAQLVPGESLQEGLARADSALYDAKVQGRACSVSAADPAVIRAGHDHVLAHDHDSATSRRA